MTEDKTGEEPGFAEPESSAPLNPPKTGIMRRRKTSAAFEKALDAVENMNKPRRGE